jgi:curved DNA-binding protein
MKIKDYYKILDIERTASSEDIKKAYLKLARKYHPDVNNKDKDKEKKFKEVTEAYKVLGNLDNRLKYMMLLNSDKKLIEEIEKKTVLMKKKKR